jgi:hypothetical protein
LSFLIINVPSSTAASMSRFAFLEVFCFARDIRCRDKETPSESCFAETEMRKSSTLLFNFKIRGEYYKNVLWKETSEAIFPYPFDMLARKHYQHLLDR